MKIEWPEGYIDTAKVIILKGSALLSMFIFPFLGLPIVFLIGSKADNQKILLTKYESLNYQATVSLIMISISFVISMVDDQQIQVPLILTMFIFMVYQLCVFLGWVADWQWAVKHRLSWSIPFKKMAKSES